MITPNGNDSDIVELYIADASLEDASAKLRITIVAKLRVMRTLALAHLQRAAMAAAQDALTSILRQKFGRLQSLAAR